MRVLFFVFICISLVLGSSDPDATLQFAGKNNKAYFFHSDFKACNVDKTVLWCVKNISWLNSDYVSTYNNLAYYTDWDGYVGAFDIVDKCNTIWVTYLPNQTGRTGPRAANGGKMSSSRNTPALIPELGMMIIGDLSSGRVWSLNMSNGNIIWEKLLDSYFLARITSSPSVDGNYVYVGVSSLDEGDPACFGASSPETSNCKFHGFIVKLRLSDGVEMWRFYTSPLTQDDPYGYAGDAVWGSRFVVFKNKLFFATGNTYRVPNNVSACLLANGTIDQCVDPRQLSDAIVVVDINTGKKVWSLSTALDIFTIACTYDGAPPSFHLPSCNANLTDWDIDFGQSPMLGTIMKHGKKKNVLIVGQKSGFVWRIDLDDNGNMVGKITKSVGPQSSVGGVLYGKTWNDDGVFVSNANGGKINYTLINGNWCNGGAVTSLNPSNLEILWQWCEPSGSRTYGLLSSTKDLVWTGSLNSTAPNLFALHSKTGKLMWSTSTPGSRFSSPVFYKNYAIVGSGYPTGKNIPDNHIYVYKVPDQYLHCRDDHNNNDEHDGNGDDD